MIDAQFQQILGRAPTPDELAFFNKYLNSGDLGAHEIGQVLQNTPEYQNSLLTKNLGQYGDVLQANDSKVLQQGADVAGTQAISRFASLGRPNSSAMAAQVFGKTGQLAGQLAQSRQSALADFYGRGLQQNAALGAQNGQSALSRAYFTADRRHQEDQDQYWYNRQQNDFNNAKNAAGGWNAITPEFGVNALVGVGGKVLGSYAGGRAAAGKGLF